MKGAWQAGRKAGRKEEPEKEGTEGGVKARMHESKSMNGRKKGREGR